MRKLIALATAGLTGLLALQLSAPAAAPDAPAPVPNVKVSVDPKSNAPAPAGGDGWVAIFNGKDLEGWKIAYGGKGNKDNSTWKVVDGVIVGEGEVSHLFSPRDDYENFEVRAELWISDKGNSGFYFRTAFGPGFPAGYEAQVNATHGDPVRTGSIYNNVKIFKQLHKPEEWFTYHLKVVGNRITVTVNGELQYEYVDQSSKFKKGHFAFQQHNLGSVVKIRKLEVKELPASPATKAAKPGPKA